MAQIDPFTHAVELIRFAAYGKMNWIALAIVIAVGMAAFLIAMLGYDPQRGLLMRKVRA